MIESVQHSQLLRITRLKDAGHLSEGEFSQMKSRILSGPTAVEDCIQLTAKNDYEPLVIRDWKRVANVFSVYFGIIFTTGLFGLLGLTPILAVTGLATLFAPFALASQMKGVRITDDGRLIAPNPFPPLIGSRTVKLAEVSDANAEFFTRKNVGLVLLQATDKRNRHDLKKDRYYCVNLSGQFGSRTIRFQEKRKRDQLLSYLRSEVPHIRITRWS